MRLRVWCPDCLFGSLRRGERKRKRQDVHAELTDDGVLEYSCGVGHTGKFILNNPRFTILFDFGVLAILDGYQREAVTSFAAAMERFHEFYVRVICRAKGVSVEAMTGAWKAMASQSERQLGAFIACHIIEEGRAPKLLDAAFRNSIVHKGAFASRDEAMKYGDETFRYIWAGLDPLIEKYGDAVKETMHDEASRRASGKKGGAFVYETSIDLYPTPESQHLTSFAQALEALEKHRKHVYRR